MMVDKLVEECTVNIDKDKMARIILDEYEKECKSSWTLYIVLLSMIFTINIGVATYFVYYKYMNHGEKTVAKGSIFQTTFY